MHFHMQATPHIVARTSRRNVILQTARTSSSVAPIKFQHDLLEKHSKSVQGVLLSRQANLFLNGLLVFTRPMPARYNVPIISNESLLHFEQPRRC